MDDQTPFRAPVLHFPLVGGKIVTVHDHDAGPQMSTGKPRWQNGNYWFLIT
jgi:hypothetical protein